LSNLLCSEEYYSGGYYASPEDAYTYTAHAQHVLSSSPTAHGLSSSAHAQHLLSSSPTAHAPHGLSSSAHAQHLLSSSPYHNGEDMRASASQLYRDAGEQHNCGFSVLELRKKMHHYTDSFNFYVDTDNVTDPDPNPDPCVFGPPGSGSISQRHGSGSIGSFYQAKTVRKPLIPTVL
jgi:hypothetical protein